jgi:hypothetical protein
MITGGELGDDTTVLPVEFDLTIEALGNNALSGAIDRYTGLITGSFYAKYVQLSDRLIVGSLDSTDFTGENLK